MKRINDLILLCLIAPFALPMVLLTAIAVLFALGRPVIFKQARPGFKGQIFMMWKFRSMTNDRNSQGEFLPDEKRLTRLGRFIRATSLDELPCMWNLLKGDITLVGPRPLLTSYLPLYSARQMQRHNVRPGITGWAQVNGRNNLTWEEKFELDLWYIDNQSFWLDMKILVLTIWKVLARKDINQDGSATMPPFKGTPSDLK
jgi:sugar transferase EpsL